MREGEREGEKAGEREGGKIFKNVRQRFLGSNLLFCSQSCQTLRVVGSFRALPIAYASKPPRSTHTTDNGPLLMGSSHRKSTAIQREKPYKYALHVYILYIITYQQTNITVLHPAMLLYTAQPHQVAARMLFTALNVMEFHKINKQTNKTTKHLS